MADVPQILWFCFGGCQKLGSMLLVNLHWFVKKNEELKKVSNLLIFLLADKKMSKNAHFFKLLIFFTNQWRFIFFSQKSEHLLIFVCNSTFLHKKVNFCNFCGEVVRFCFLLFSGGGTKTSLSWWTICAHNSAQSYISLWLMWIQHSYCTNQNKNVQIT